MTQEDKELLLKDLCARLPYGVKINVNGEEDTSLELGVNTGWVNASYDIEEVRSYLRPMSSMTKEEEYEYHRYKNNDYLEIFNQEHYKIIKTTALMFSNAIDWLNEHHFDYRGLIEKGLALEAPEGMYKLIEK